MADPTTDPKTSSGEESEPVDALRHRRSETPPTAHGNPVMNGIRGRCPRCGEGRLFRGYLRIADACGVCGLSLKGHDTGDGPVVPVLLIIGGMVVGLALAVEVIYEPSVLVHLLIWIPLGTILTLAIMPRLKGMAVGLQYKYRSTEEDTPIGGI